MLLFGIWDDSREIPLVAPSLSAFLVPWVEHQEFPCLATFSMKEFFLISSPSLSRCRFPLLSFLFWSFSHFSLHPLHLFHLWFLSRPHPSPASQEGMGITPSQIREVAALPNPAYFSLLFLLPTTHGNEIHPFSHPNVGISWRFSLETV